MTNRSNGYAMRISIKTGETRLMHPNAGVSFRQEGPLSSRPIPMTEKKRAEQGDSDLTVRRQMLLWVREMKPMLYRAYVNAESSLWHALESNKHKSDAEKHCRDMKLIWRRIESAFNAQAA